VVGEVQWIDGCSSHHGAKPARRVIDCRTSAFTYLVNMQGTRYSLASIKMLHLACKAFGKVDSMGPWDRIFFF
jgi:hypothetical protein